MFLPVDQVVKNEKTLSNEELAASFDQYPSDGEYREDDQDAPELEAFGLHECGIGDIGASWEGMDSMSDR